MTVTRKVVSSAMFATSAKMLSKALGILSTMVLARILAPEQFGFIAIISIALYFFDILSHTASEQYVIQRAVVTKKQLDTAWSLNLIVKIVISVVIASTAPWVALFFERPELSNAIALSAIILPIQALKSPLYILLKRQLKFSLLFWSSLIERVLAVPFLITLAIFFKSYWAFIVTDIFAALVAVIISYIIAKKRPSFTLIEFSTQWAFSKWLLAKSIVGYTRSQIDTVVVSRTFSSGVLGNYHMARELAMMPAHFLLSPAIEPLLSAFKNDKDRKDELLNNVAFTLIAVLIVIIPLCAYIWKFSEELVFLFLGDNWNEAGKLLSILSFLFLYWTLLHVVETALIAQERVKLIFCFDLFSLALITTSLLIGVYLSLSIDDLVWVRVGSGLFGTLILLGVLFSGHMQRLTPVVLVGAVVSFVSYLWIGIEQYKLNTDSYWRLVTELIPQGLLLLAFVVCSILTLTLFTKQHHLCRLILIIRNFLIR